jgi:protein SCO1/2
MRSSRSRNSAAITAILTIFIAASGSSAQLVQDSVPDLQRIDVIEHLGQTIPLDLEFLNSHGESVHLRDYFGRGKPVILSLHYTNCPMLCSLVLNGLSKTVNELAYTPGEEFQMLSVSFDPRETPQLAAAIKERYQGTLKVGAPADAWEFLVGPESHSKALAEALGFKYYYIEKTGEFAHPAVIFVLTQDGRISRYIYGINFKERDLRLALLEASEGKIGNTVDRLILYCFHYDPDAKGYVVLAGNVMKLGGAASLILLGLFLGFLWGKERLRKKSA